MTQRIVDMRWRAAVAQRRSDGGAAIAQFRRRWEAPGLAVIVDNAHARLVLFMRDTTRSRWRRHATSAREFRNQQHAPPDPPPADMIEIYTAGDGDVGEDVLPDLRASPSMMGGAVSSDVMAAQRLGAKGHSISLGERSMEQPPTLCDRAISVGNSSSHFNIVHSHKSLRFIALRSHSRCAICW